MGKPLTALLSPEAAHELSRDIPDGLVAARLLIGEVPQVGQARLKLVQQLGMPRREEADSAEEQMLDGHLAASGVGDLAGGVGRLVHATVTTQPGPGSRPGRDASPRRESGSAALGHAYSAAAAMPPAK